MIAVPASGIVCMISSIAMISNRVFVIGSLVDIQLKSCTVRFISLDQAGRYSGFLALLTMGGGPSVSGYGSLGFPFDRIGMV